MPETYTPMDQYRDFRKVFTGSEEGQRVMRVILSWGRLTRSSPAMRAAGPIDPLRMAFCEGERNIATRLLTTVNVEPQQPATRPVRARTNPKGK